MHRSRTRWIPALTALLLACEGAATKPTETKSAPVEAEADAKDAPAEAPRPDLPKAEEVLAEVVEASGGGAKFDAIQSYYMEAKVEIVGLGVSGVAKTWWRKGEGGAAGDFYNELDMPGLGLVRGGSLAGKSWSQEPIQGLRELSGKEAATAAWSSSLNLAHEWRRYFDKAETTKVDDSGGKKIAEITLTSAKSGSNVVLKIDLADKRMIGQRFSQPSPMGEMPVEVTLEDFRAHEGLTLPFKQSVDAKLQKMQQEVTKLELGAPVDAVKFGLPTAGEPVAVPPAGEAKAP